MYFDIKLNKRTIKFISSPIDGLLFLLDSLSSFVGFNVLSES